MIAVVVGTRPDIIKTSPVIVEMEKRKMSFEVIHTGQHYSKNMDRMFFEDLGLQYPVSKVSSSKNCKSHGRQTARMLVGIEAALESISPMGVLVQGDSNTALAGALAGRKLRMKVYHIEAGLRSWDWRMPEEHNRVMIDHISDVLFAPTDVSKSNLISEGIHGDVYVVGNTIVDAVNQSLDRINGSRILEDTGLKYRRYVILTLHREENVDDSVLMSKLFNELEKIYCSSCSMADLSMVFPVHPRTRNRDWFEQLREYHFLRVVDPLGYLDFLKLLSHCRYVMTDSGGVQEEACIMQVPCLTLRDSTERPETVDVGANIVVGSDGHGLRDGIKSIELNGRRSNPKWIHPFGKGNTAELICDVLEE